MDREQFKILLIEEQIFEELKDSYFGGIGYIRCKYEGSGIDFSRVYRRIINYRIATYGTSTLYSPRHYTYKDSKTRIREARNSRLRKKYWREKYDR